MYNKKQLIKDCIKYNATPEVRARGRKLFEVGAVNLIEHIDKADNWNFVVQGSKKYDIKIGGLNNNNIQTTCNCPFDYGRLCKHSIAALHYISETIDDDYVSPILNKPNEDYTRSDVKSKYEITEYQNLTEKWIFNNLETRTYTNLQENYYQYCIENFKVYDNKLVFNVEVNFSKYTVTFHSEQEKVFVTSTERSFARKLKLSEAFCLKVIATSKHNNLLDIFLFKGINNLKTKALKDFGLNLSVDFDDLFSYDFNQEQGLVIKCKDRAKGLVPLTDNIHSPILDQIHDSDNDLMPLPNFKKDIEQREIGFVFKFNKALNNKYVGDESDLYEEDNPDDYQDCEIIPIIGKVGKTGTILSSHIEEYGKFCEEIYSIKKSDKQKQVLHLLDLMNDASGRATKFEYKKAAFNLLVGENFIYSLTSGKFEIRKMDLELISLSSDELEVYYNVSDNNEFIQTELKVKIKDRIINPGKIKSLQSDNIIYTLEGICYCSKNYLAGNAIDKYRGAIKMVRTHKQIFFEKVIKPLSRNFEIVFEDNTFNLETIELDFHKKQIYLSEADNHLIITPKVVYDNNKSVALYNYGDILVNQEKKILAYKRNHELEADFIEQIAGLHPNFEIQKSKNIFYLHMNDFVENLWFYKFFDQLTANNVEIFGLKDLKNFKYSPFKGKIATSVSSGQDWFEVKIDVSFGNNTVSLKEIRKAVLKKEKFIRLKDGSVGVMPTDWFHKLEKYFRNGEIKKEKLEISKLRFSIVDELFDNINDAEILEELSEKKRRLASFSEITETLVPSEIKAELRHYQKAGLNWLNFLNEMQWGGILADDMGLGKTLQVLSFLQHLNKKENTTNLIVVPTTLLFNWQNEIEKFAPNLKAYYHYGTDRPKTTIGFENYQLVFTTYGVLIRDIEMLRKFRFNYAILDESQAIKNPASRRYKAANLIQSNNRLALSGTPIENSTFDLFAQMNFVNRGMLGGVSLFKENYSNPIDKEGNDLMANELHRIVSPFILRRTKEKVANELPPKTEDIIYCEMENEQRKVYDAYRNKFKTELLAKITDDGIGKSKMMVLEALTRLRQICDSPALLTKERIQTTESVKIKEILRHITNKTANHKILVFSQFVKMLELVKDELERMNIKYEYLDGQCNTKQRETSVKNFQKNDDLRVFLISIKAGGTGLNLTAADYVYILDPWWNPAVENQAIDRCYRIGQDKKVFAYRMICRNTVEEKILNLQHKKKKIAGDIIQTDENIMKTINSDDIKELFS